MSHYMNVYFTSECEEYHCKMNQICTPWYYYYYYYYYYIIVLYNNNNNDNKPGSVNKCENNEPGIHTKAK